MITFEGVMESWKYQREDDASPGKCLEYVYDILPPGESARYMILQPGKDDEPLRCTLHTVSLDNMPDFEAISYVWGNSCKDHFITCGQQRIYITANLHNALSYVRLDSRPRKLWADSICIHQADRNEQSHQVALMSQIYSRTKATLVCLSKDDAGHAAHVEALVFRVNKIIEGLPHKVRYNENNYPYITANDPLLSDPGWDSIQVLLQQPWFHRQWVVQEAALAPRSMLLWGTHEIDWVSFLWTVMYIHALARPFIRRWSTWLPDVHCLRLSSDLDSLPQVLRTLMRGFKMEVIDILRQGRALGVTDPKDRIYSVLGLAEIFSADQKKVKITPDYSRPVTDIFHEFAERYLEVTKNIDILNCVQHDEESVMSQYPSWVPQWSASPSFVPTLRGRTQLLSRSKTTSEPIVLGGGKLKLRGVILDRIHLASETFIPTADELKPQAAQIWNQVKGTGSHSTYASATQHLAFTWTLGGGKRTGTSVEREKESEAQYLFELHRHGAQFDDRLKEDIQAWSQMDPDDGFATMVCKIAGDRRFVLTERGYYGLGPGMARKGDLCCIVFGARSPYILRETTTKGQYRLVGDIYITSETSNAGWSGWLGNKKGFTLFGRSNGKEWADWDLEEQDIILC
ncbi:heterokaryon incompatibility protein-domain-containing protein [Paramyrothecium foliicola]|nr:heterokaryon incompatibility protein-domain-containing protein [Paramyrothecium foliicola]